MTTTCFGFSCENLALYLAHLTGMICCFIHVVSFLKFPYKYRQNTAVAVLFITSFFLMILVPGELVSRFHLTPEVAFRAKIAKRILIWFVPSLIPVVVSRSKAYYLHKSEFET